MRSKEQTAHLLLALATLAVGLTLYLHIANIQIAVNDDYTQSDQRAYVRFAKEARESDFTYTGSRNRMPFLPFMLAMLDAPEISEVELFERGKVLNIGISLICIFLLGLALFRRFDRVYALYALTLIAFLLYSLKSAFVQAELLYYTLYGLAFALGIETIRRPSLRKSIGLGFLFALAHYSKAGAMLGLLVYSGSFFPLLLAPPPQFELG